jgi:CDGSH-type Zn-finger protein
VADLPVRITVKANGPLVIEGPVTIMDADGNPLTPPPAKTPGVIKLCRCGRSGNKPFCDGSHRLALPGADS